MKGIKYSFVMPAYKAAFIREAIESILGQTYTDFELIIVDDASPEGLEAIVSEYNDPRLTYHKNEQNIGGKDLVAQWNHSIEYANGEFLILASDDDIYDKDYLLSMNYLTNKYSNVNVFRPLIQSINIHGHIRVEDGSRINEFLSFKDYLNVFFDDILFSGIPQYMFRSSVLKEIGGFVNFPLAWYSDDATVAKMALNGMAVYKKVLFSIRNSNQNISGKTNSIEMVEKKIDASLLYVSFMDSINNTECHPMMQSHEYIKMINRVRRSSIYTLKHATSLTFIKGTKYIHRLHSNIYPIEWQFKRLIGYVYHRIIHQ